MKHKMICLLTALVGAALILASCGGQSGEKGSAANNAAAEFILGNGAEPQSLDPAKIQGVPEHRINMALFEGLVGYDPKTSTAVPGVAESWDISEDGMTYTFHLRNAQWSDGTPITAKTFVDSWLRMLAPETGSQYVFMINMVVKGAEEYNTGKADASAVAIKAVDDKTFEVQLTGPAPYVIDMLAHYAFNPMPMHTIEKFGNDWIKPGNFVGNGPFVLETWVPQEKITVVPNDKYWNKENVHLSRITFLPIEDSNTSYEKYKAGELDWNTGIPVPRIDEVKQLPDYQVAPQLSTYYYIFNVKRGPLQDARVRKALTLALDRQELVEKVTKAGQVATRSMVPPMAGYTPGQGAGYDPELGKKLLAEAGYPDGKGFPSLTVIYNTLEGHKMIAEYVQESWKRNLGVEVKIQNYEWKTYIDKRNQHDFDITRAGWTGDYQDPNTFLELFLTDGSNNNGQYGNAEYDALIRKAATMKGGAERFQVLHDAETILLEQDQALLPMYSYVSQNIIDTTKWEGWYNNPQDIHPYVGLKKVK
ncbi:MULTISPECIES: ABC transporter substrate-binding protein [unclassified Treponema]|uniref:peptide ABC transporter substrate-binding protein n=1 Tax=unclassified Treponema TaxID=2638727 RepID=UPI0005301471|nr:MULTISPECIES: peptide ABC transporter substrate-binding protein [unclassified Treponema]AIW88713.1 ABC transporter substrate-binding protein [Treponema sp. OMZ 838]UTC44304.1 peptide ABC transporter substrate-binding protein [Treponema sp. OMZ 857]UTC51285.1 peptide ABC transporter substrate-binding protein [Treponema sp. OMZ 855]